MQNLDRESFKISLRISVSFYKIHTFLSPVVADNVAYNGLFAIYLLLLILVMTAVWAIGGMGFID